jgi:hypothetical protein
MTQGKEVSNIVQIPAIIKSGAVELLSPEMLKLDESDLKKMAMVMGGNLVYMKLRAVYTELETPLCMYDNCFRPVADLWCDDHPNGNDISKRSAGSTNVHSIRGIVNPRTA